MVRELALSSLVLLGAVFLTHRAWGFQRPAAPPTSTHHVNADNTITFRYKDATAARVVIDTDAALKPLTMSKGEDGFWTATTEPLQPEIYGYTFVVDGFPSLDPRNGDLRHNLAFPSNEVTVPGQPASPWELTAIPHGVVSRHVFTTHVAKNLPQDQSAYIVYTPPGYDPKHKGGYPVLYLLHGYTDAEDGWTAVGRAHLILDSLIGSGKAVPMVVVMPLGYGDYSFLQRGHGVWQDVAAVNSNVSLYSDVLLDEIVPAVEREYNVAKGPENHAIAGLSMGGLQSLSIGLNHTDRFAYVGAFSSALERQSYDSLFPPAVSAKANLRLLWTACGTDDHLITVNRAFFTWAKAKDLPVTVVETPGAHTWLVWRDNLLHFAPLLFRK